MAELPVGETVLVRPGERIPADGLVTLGTSVADESMLTGAALFWSLRCCKLARAR